MTNKKLVLGKWALIGLLAAAAGVFYCCGSTGTDRVTLAKDNGGNTITEDTVTENILTEGAADEGALAKAASGEAEIPANDKDPEENTEASVCYVYVCGEVLYPGVYRLSEGQRIYEAIGLAGGFTPEAAQSYLNLAQPVTDGMKIEVPDQEQASVMPAETAGIAAVSADSGKININTADRSQLMTLSGIGEARAEAIIAYRTEHGNFQTIEDIMKVSGIKDAAFQKIKEKITV